MSSASLAGTAPLSARPSPPIPALDDPLSPDALTEALRAFSVSYYAVHPFHARMHAGALSPRQLQLWVANRFCYQRAIPRKDAAILSNCPDVDVRRRWMQRIIDHDGTAPDTGGLAMWVRLGEALGVERAAMLDERYVLPGVRFATEAYVIFCRTHPWVDAVASSLTELFAPDLMRQRLDAFASHYGWVDAEGLAYFRSRLTQAPRDSAHGLEIVRAHCTTVDTQRRAFAVLAFKLDVLWVMLDTIDFASRE
jgi:pyrroloquinoline-quinone synthase